MKTAFAKIIDLDKRDFILLDFTAKNIDLENLDLENTESFSEYVFNQIKKAGASAGIGGYLENRVIYRRSKHFNQQETEPRSIHLGVDIWAKSATPIFAPMDGVVHSFRNNAQFGDYGPTIILEHDFQAILQQPKVFTLYGHLSLGSLEGLFEGKVIKKGQKIAEIGNYPENGDWPPHLHFQVMTDMQGMKGDFPGVCSVAEKTKFQEICINPYPFLGLDF